jgi:hypothetical protein
VAKEVTQHGRAHPYSWPITIVSLRSKKSEECHRSEWKTKLLSMFLAVTCQHASGVCQSHSRPVLNLREASRKYIELSPSTLPFLTLQFYEKDLMPTPNLLQISGPFSLHLSIFDTPSTWAYLFNGAIFDADKIVPQISRREVSGKTVIPAHSTGLQTMQRSLNCHSGASRMILASWTLPR